MQCCSTASLRTLVRRTRWVLDSHGWRSLRGILTGRCVSRHQWSCFLTRMARHGHRRRYYHTRAISPRRSLMNKRRRQAFCRQIIQAGGLNATMCHGICGSIGVLLSIPNFRLRILPQRYENPKCHMISLSSVVRCSRLPLVSSPGVFPRLRMVATSSSHWRLWPSPFCVAPAVSSLALPPAKA